MNIPEIKVLRLIIGASLVVAGCATAGTESRPGTGSITVGVTTEGGEPRLMAFTITIEPRGVTGSIAADAGVFTAHDLPPGEYVVRLSGLPDRCIAEDNGEARVMVEARHTLAVHYIVACKAIPNP